MTEAPITETLSTGRYGPLFGVLIRTPRRADTWRAWEADFKAAALECCTMLDKDAEAMRLADELLKVVGLERQAERYRRIEALIARKLHALLKARETGPRLHLSSPSITPLAHVCPHRRQLRCVVLLSWRGQQCRQAVEITIKESTNGTA